MPEATRPLTFGEKAVGLTFNPGGDEKVTAIKTQFALIIDIINDLRSTNESPEAKRLYSIAISDAQVSQMFAVKAATWKD